MFSPQEIIRKKRDGRSLSTEEIQQFVSGVTSQTVEDSQVAAFAMAVFFQGMTLDERVALTLAMRDSGQVLNWTDLRLDGPVIDKHSTGGVGDVVSVMLGPLLAACGGYVPMVSGRGLGHTGGTVDKLESIPGYNTAPSLGRLREIVQKVGVAIVGQTDDIAPADRRMYGIRDVTATVESIDLITASILSKKLAAGLDALVMDVKVGSGAFMKNPEESKRLAGSIVEVACGAGTQTSALLTDMNQCLAATAGNSLEIREAAAFLRGEIRSPRLHDVTLELGAELLVAAAIDNGLDDARLRLQTALDSGAAADKFDQMVVELGGPSEFVRRADELLKPAPFVRAVFSDHFGYAARVNVRQLGVAVVTLGGGRTRAGEAIDHAVGLEDVLPLGEMTDEQRPLAVVHARDEATWRQAATIVTNAYELSGDPVTPPPVVQEVVRAS